MIKTVIIDNYDSFTYNLSHLLKELGASVTVVRNDKFRIEDLEQFDKIVLSPGPGIPSEAGLMPGEAFGAKLLNIGNVVHGVATPAHLTAQDYLFEGLASDLEVGRYHSWVVDDKDLPQCLEVTSRSDDGYIMSLRHREYDVRGIQFHPESVLTPQGKTIINNWLNNK